MPSWSQLCPLRDCVHGELWPIHAAPWSPSAPAHTHTGCFSKCLRESDREARGRSCAPLFQRKQYLLPHLIAILNKVMQFSLRMLLSSLKQQLEEQKEGSNDFMLPVKPQLRSGVVELTADLSWAGQTIWSNMAKSVGRTETELHQTLCHFLFSTHQHCAVTVIWILLAHLTQHRRGREWSLLALRSDWLQQVHPPLEQDFSVLPHKEVSPRWSGIAHRYRLLHLWDTCISC